MSSLEHFSFFCESLNTQNLHTRGEKEHIEKYLDVCKETHLRDAFSTGFRTDFFLAPREHEEPERKRRTEKTHLCISVSVSKKIRIEWRRAAKKRE